MRREVLEIHLEGSPVDWESIQWRELVEAWDGFSWGVEGLR